MGLNIYDVHTARGGRGLTIDLFFIIDGGGYWYLGYSR